MEKQEIRNKLLSSINKHKDSNEWTNLVKVGPSLKESGVDYKALGYEKLFQLVKEHKDCINWRVDNITPTVTVIYVREKTPSEKRRFLAIQNAQDNPISVTSDPANALTNWASLGDFSKIFEDLKSLSLNERWFFSDSNPNQPYPILVKYLKYTFFRLRQEGDKIIELENYAAFNTGLVDKRYEPIYAMFAKTPNALRKWRFEGFCIPGEDKLGKDLVRYFNPLPKRAHYFDKVSDMLYDTLSPKPELDWHHIVVENVDRLPANFVFENCPKDFTLTNVENLNNAEQDEYYKNLAKAIVNDTKTYRNITNRFKDALELALKRIEWNFKTAIPMYFPTLNKMSILLPLALVDDENVDIALVVEKTESGNYLGHTILPLEWAYSNARLVCRPDSDWLVADQIKSTTIEEKISDG